MPPSNKWLHTLQEAREWAADYLKETGNKFCGIMRRDADQVFFILPPMMDVPRGFTMVERFPKERDFVPR
jgi:hypothetical protein